MHSQMPMISQSPLGGDRGHVAPIVHLPLHRAPKPLTRIDRAAILDFFLPRLPRDARVLHVGCGDNWFKRGAAARGWSSVTGLDLRPPADVVGDVRNALDLGFEPWSFDAVVAADLVEHGDFSKPLHDLLKPTGLLLLTTPVPRMDGVCRALETLGIVERRASPHTHLVDVRRFPRFHVVERRIRFGISQWAILRPGRVIDLTGPC
jgi:SAM-dependent methyltransferase